jgi:hypothetical protein
VDVEALDVHVEGAPVDDDDLRVNAGVLHVDHDEAGVDDDERDVITEARDVNDDDVGVHVETLDRNDDGLGVHVDRLGVDDEGLGVHVDRLGVHIDELVVHVEKLDVEANDFSYLGKSALRRERRGAAGEGGVEVELDGVAVAHEEVDGLAHRGRGVEEADADAAGAADAVVEQPADLGGDGEGLAEDAQADPEPVADRERRAGLEEQAAGGDVAGAPGVEVGAGGEGDVRREMQARGLATLPRVGVRFGVGGAWHSRRDVIGAARGPLSARTGQDRWGF